MYRRTGILILLGLLAWGSALNPPAGTLNASESSMITSSTTAVNVKHVVKGEEHKGVLEISHGGISHVSEHTVWVQSVPWNQIVQWRCFGSKDANPNEEDLCILWIQLKKDSPSTARHLFFKVPCEIVPGQENWKTLESYDTRDNF